MACVELGINPREAWKMTYREIAPALRLKSTGDYSVCKTEMTAQESIDEMTEKLRKKGVNV